jgi:UPF0716 protein FxsA
VVRIFPILLAAFVVVPIAEIALLVSLGSRIGVGETIAIVIVTAIIGAALVSRQSRGAISAVQTEFFSGRFPATELAHAAMILVAGALLLTPGFLTDLVGFALLVPGVRETIRKWTVRRYRPDVIILDE